MKKYLEKIYRQDKKNYYQRLTEILKNNGKKMIVTVNPECLMMAKDDKTLSTILLDKEIDLVPDGIAIVKACQKLGISINERITGIDISKFLLEESNKQKKSLYLFGAQKEVIETLIKKIKLDYPNINILGYKNGYEDDKEKVMKEIVALAPDICLVALGMGIQEKLIYKYIDQVTKGIYVGVGGSFDVLSGRKKRAPQIFIKLNLEWLYRIIKEPKRIRRFWKYNIKFLKEIKK